MSADNTKPAQVDVRVVLLVRMEDCLRLAELETDPEHRQWLKGQAAKAKTAHEALEALIDAACCAEKELLPFGRAGATRAQLRATLAGVRGGSQ